MSSIVLSGDTSGTITLDAPAVAGTNTLTLPASTGNVVVDSATQTLTNKSIAATQLTGTIAKARLPTGSILQVIQTTLAASSWSTTSTSDVSTGLSASITPTSSTSKVLVMYGGRIDSTSTNVAAMTSLYKNSSSLAADLAANYTASGGYLATTLAFVYLDSPATTSSTTYQVYGRISYGSGTISQTGLWTMTLMEVAA